LVEGGLRAMFVTRLMTAGALIVALGTAGAGVGVMARQAPVAKAAARPQVASPAGNQDLGRRPRTAEEKSEMPRPWSAIQDQPELDRAAFEKTLQLLLQARDHTEKTL